MLFLLLWLLMKDRLINSEALIKSLSEGPAWHENTFCV